MAETTLEPKSAPKNIVTVDLTPEVYQRMAEAAQLSSPAAIPAADDPGSASWQQNVDLTDARLKDLARKALGHDLPQDTAKIGADAVHGKPAAAPPPAESDPVEEIWKQIEEARHAYLTKAKAAESVAQRGLEQQIRLTVPAAENVARVAREHPIPKLGPFAPEPALPPTKPKPFVSADGQNAILGIISGLGAITQAIAGWRAPIGGLNAMQGMMTGWQEGDADRVAREYQKYEAEVQKMQRENERAMQIYEAARTRRADDLGAAQIEMETALAVANLYPQMAMVAEKGVDHAGQVFTMTANTAQKILMQQNRHIEQEMRRQRLDVTLPLLMARLQSIGERPSDEMVAGLAEWAEARGGALPPGVLSGFYAGETRNRIAQELLRRGGRVQLAPETAAAPPAAGAPGAPGAGRSLVANEVQLRADKKQSDTLAARQANMEQAVVEAKSLIPVIRDAAEGVTRSSSPFINRFISSLIYNVPFDEEGSAAEQKLKVALNTFIPVYVRAMKGTGVPDVTSGEHAREMITKNLSLGQMNAALEQLEFEMDVALQSPDVVRERIMARIKGQPAPPVKPVVPPRSGQATTTTAPAAAAAPRPSAPIDPKSVAPINSQAEYDALPKGTPYRDSEGNYGVKQ